MRPIPLARVPFPEQILLGFSLFSLLWRGGKGLEVTWLLVGVAVLLTMFNLLKGSEEAQQGAPRPAYYPVGLPVLAAGFFAWTIASFFFSSTANYGLDEVLRDGALVLVFLWTMERAMRGDAAIFVRRFTSTISIGTVLAIAFGILVYAMQPVNRFVGTFFDYRFHTDYWPNAWAQYLLLAWPMLVLWMQGKTAKLQACPELCRRVAGCIFLGGVFGALLLSYSRGAMIASGGQLLLLGVWYATKGKRTSEVRLQITPKRIAFNLAAVALVAFGMFFSVNILRGNYHPVQSATEKITFTADEGGSSVSERAQFWDQSIELIRQKPLYGWGPYSFRFIHQRLQTGVLETSDHPHNLFLKLAVERGVPAAMFFVVLLLVILLSPIRLQIANCRSKSLQPENIPQTHGKHKDNLFLIIAVLGVLAHNLIDYNLQFVGIALPFWIMLGVLAGQSAKRKEPFDKAHLDAEHSMPRQERQRVKLLSNKFVQIFGLILAIILTIISLYEGLYLVTSSFGRHAEARGDAASALWWYDRSLGEYFSRDMHLSRALLATKNGETDRAQEAITTYLELNAEDPRGWRLQGDIARTRGDADEAMEAYRHAYDTGRWNDLSITLALAQTLAGTGQKELEILKPEIDILLNAFADGITRNAHFIALSHNAEDAIALADLLAAAFPKDAPRYEVLAAKTDYAMRTERAKVRSRPAGYLW